jgi:hypothetical protein
MVLFLVLGLLLGSLVSWFWIIWVADSHHPLL